MACGSGEERQCGGRSRRGEVGQVAVSMGQATGGGPGDRFQAKVGSSTELYASKCEPKTRVAIRALSLIMSMVKSWYNLEGICECVDHVRTRCHHHSAVRQYLIII
jgi:hypothetical protein